MARYTDEQAIAQSQHSFHALSPGRQLPGDRRGHRVLIPQEAYVFAGTMREKLCDLHPDVMTEEIDDAAERLEARPLVPSRMANSRSTRASAAGSR